MTYSNNFQMTRVLIQTLQQNFGAGVDMKTSPRLLAAEFTWFKCKFMCVKPGKARFRRDFIRWSYKKNYWDSRGEAKYTLCLLVSQVPRNNRRYVSNKCECACVCAHTRWEQEELLIQQKAWSHSREDRDKSKDGGMGWGGSFIPLSLVLGKEWRMGGINPWINMGKN